MIKNKLILIDIQKEYTSKNRPFYLNGIEKSLANCKTVLQLARELNWSIVHIKHLKAGSPIFNPESDFSNFSEGFMPNSGELVIQKNLYSCYSSQAFIEFMNNGHLVDAYIIGYNSIMCCLSTIIEGYHRGHRLVFVEDASLAKATPEYNEEEMHNYSVSAVRAAKYAELISTKELLSKYS